MNEILFQYERVPPSTWAYLSSLLMIGLFFKFNRFWSMRNLDLLLLIALAPGLLLVHHGQLEQSNPIPLPEQQLVAPPPQTSEPVNPASQIDEPPSLAPEIEARLAQAVGWERIGYLWILTVNALLLMRVLIDPLMVRRPLLEPNLSIGGLNFISCFLFVFLMANVITGETSDSDLVGPRLADQLMTGEVDQQQLENLSHHGPGHVALNVLPSILTVNLRDAGNPEVSEYAVVAKVTAILAHLAIVVGIVGVGYWHFGNLKMGIGAATLYLMLPYTAISTGRITHILPAACLTWAVLLYRRPTLSGICLGLAVGTLYYPLFLLPLWISFYWQRGLSRFLGGIAGMLLLLVLLLPWIPSESVSFWQKLSSMFGIQMPAMEGLQGVWKLSWDPNYRWPVLVAFVCLSIFFAVWPPQKNLGSLLCCSAAVMLAVQFCHGFGGGDYVAWYLPLLLLTVFRPNLEDRVALTVLSDGSKKKRRRPLGAVDRAA